MMEENSFNAAYDALDRITKILHEMLWMAARATDSDCSPAERALLQRDFAALSEHVNRLAEQYESAATDMKNAIATIQAIMETRQAAAPEGESGLQ